MTAEWADQPSLPDHGGIPGKILAAQREKLGWTVEQVADQLKLAVRQVTALESGDYAALPGPAVVRGFVRAYAKVVRLEPAPLVAMIPLGSAAADEPVSGPVRHSKPASFSEVRFPSNGKRKSFMPLLAIGGVVLLVAAAGLAWQFGAIPTQLLGSSSKPVATPADATPQASVTVLAPPIGAAAPSAPAPKPVEGQHAPVINNSVPLISVPPAPNGAPAAGANAPATAPAGTAPTAGTAPAPAPASAAPAVAAPTAENKLVLTVRQDSWVEVRPAKGKPLFSRLVKGGSVETIDVGDQPLTMVVGRPDAVSASLRGVPVDLPVAPGGKTARVQLK